MQHLSKLRSPIASAQLCHGLLLCWARSSAGFTCCVSQAACSWSPSSEQQHRRWVPGVCGLRAPAEPLSAVGCAAGAPASGSWEAAGQEAGREGAGVWTPGEGCCVSAGWGSQTSARRRTGICVLAGFLLNLLKWFIRPIFGLVLVCFRKR